MTTGDLCLVVLTAPDPDWTSRFVRGLVMDRLCAAAHVFPMSAIYIWNGEMNDVDECRAELHTRRALVPDIVERVKRDHPYEVPGVVVVPLMDGSPDYLRWVHDETS